jgi:hypothetical protein
MSPEIPVAWEAISGHTSLTFFISTEKGFIAMPMPLEEIGKPPLQNWHFRDLQMGVSLRGKGFFMAFYLQLFEFASRDNQFTELICLCMQHSSFPTLSLEFLAIGTIA